MPQIDFHVLSDVAPDAAWRYTCRIAEQIVDQGQHVFIRVSSAEDAKRIDDLLWTFGEQNFLPHEIASDQSPTHPLIKILIGAGDIANNFNSSNFDSSKFDPVVINLSTTIPDDIASLKRVIELVPVDAERKRAARERFKQYRDRGIEPATQNIESTVKPSA